MICLNCDGEDFNEEETEMDQEVQGKTYTVKIKGMICQNCGFVLLTDEQATNLYRAVKKQMNEEPKP